MNGYPIEQPEYDDGECPQCGDQSPGGDFCSAMCMHRYYENLKPTFVHPCTLSKINSQLRNNERENIIEPEGLELDIALFEEREQRSNYNKRNVRR
ncbi:MAG: hypothetical protein KKD18_05445 [Nanoarchaeota archaeon]|nr:hypothetical protein [Nanoarchaeota archaeon]MBU0977835.1 hypothetical protein [Nanoarchaeota archaeon]